MDTLDRTAGLTRRIKFNKNLWRRASDLSAHRESVVIPLQSLSESTKHPMSIHELNMRTPQRNLTDDMRKLLNDLPPTPSPFDFDLDQQQQITCSVRGRFLLSNKPFYDCTPSVIDDFPPSQLKFKWFAIKSQEEKEKAAVMLHLQRNTYYLYNRNSQQQSPEGTLWCNYTEKTATIRQTCTRKHLVTVGRNLEGGQSLIRF